MINKLIYGWKLNQITSLVTRAETIADNTATLATLQSKLARMHGDCPSALEHRIKTLFNL